MKRPKLRQGEIVLVKWRDVEHLSSGWMTYDEHATERPGRYATVGVVLSSSRRYLVLAPQLGKEQGAAFCSYRIPWGVVRRVHRLK